MSAAPAPAPPPPARPAPKESGCLPFMVFLLTVACACGVIALRCGVLPKEHAGGVVIEILEKPSKDDMKAHDLRIQSGAVLDRAMKALGLNQEFAVTELPDVRDRLQRNLAVTARGPFLTVTVMVLEKEHTPAEVANAIAGAYHEYLVELSSEGDRRVSQNLHAQITLNEAAAEKARLEWMDLMRRHESRPDAGSVVAEATLNEIAARLARDSAELVELENRLLTMDPADPLFADKKSGAAALKAQVNTWQKAVKEQDVKLLPRLQLRTEMDEAKYRYDSQVRLVHKLREESQDLNVRSGIVKRPTRIIEEARATTVPDRRLIKYVRIGIAGSVVLLAALLLTALATRLCRRA